MIPLSYLLKNKTPSFNLCRLIGIFRVGEFNAPFVLAVNIHNKGETVRFSSIWMIIKEN